MSSYGFYVRYEQGAQARFCVNDVPFLRTVAAGRSELGDLDTLVLPGKNVLTIDLFAAPDLEACLEVRILEEDRDSPLCRFRWPEDRSMVAPARAKPPFRVELGFETDRRRTPAWVDAAIESYGCEGSPAQRELVARLHAAIAARDLERLTDLFSLRNEEVFEASGRDPAYSHPEQRAGYASFFEREVHCRQLDLDALHFEPKADGRVCRVQRWDGDPAIEAIGLSAFSIEHPEARVSDDVTAQTEREMNQSIAMDLLLVMKHGRWQILR